MGGKYNRLQRERGGSRGWVRDDNSSTSSEGVPDIGGGVGGIIPNQVSIEIGI